VLLATRPSPVKIATYCLPPASKVMGGALKPAHRRTDRVRWLYRLPQVTGEPGLLVYLRQHQSRVTVSEAACNCRARPALDQPLSETSAVGLPAGCKLHRLFGWRQREICRGYDVSQTRHCGPGYAQELVG
jgi:hypothetical protein